MGSFELANRVCFRYYIMDAGRGESEHRQRSKQERLKGA